ncbi:MAG: SGNH/GDSL hydrolase family protein [Thermoanaerobaculia bacterium]|nr:SGNH/GDSL hydrolase family protein [Thermoanaerobaculia bacterium]
MNPKWLAIRKTHLVSCVVAAFLVSTTLIAAEITVRMVFLPLSAFRDGIALVSDTRRYVPKPNTRVRFKGMYSALPRPVTWEFNAQGMRAAGWVPSEKREGTYRIATFGDSETFGWSVDFAETFQQQMELRNPAYEVLNLGVPGYNIANVAEHVVRTAMLYKPDLLIYLINPNDFDPPLEIHRVAIHSELARRLECLYRQAGEREIVKNRQSPARVRAFTSELARMTQFCEENRIELMAAFIDEENRSVLKEDPLLDAYFLRPGESKGRVLDVSDVFRQDQRQDGHLSREGHCRLAQRFVGVVSRRGVPRTEAYRPGTPSQPRVP